MPEDTFPLKGSKALFLPYELIEHILGFLVDEPAPEDRHPNRHTWAHNSAYLPRPFAESPAERPLYACLLVSRAFRCAASRILRERALHFGYGAEAKVWAEEFWERRGDVARHLKGQVPACWFEELAGAGRANEGWMMNADETGPVDLSHFRTLNALTLARALDEVIRRHAPHGRPSGNGAFTAWSTTAVHYLLTHCGAHLDTIVLGHPYSTELTESSAPFDKEGDEGLQLCEVNDELMANAVRLVRKFAPSLRRLRVLVPYAAFLPELTGPFEHLEELVIKAELLTGRALDDVLSLLISTLPPDPTQVRQICDPILTPSAQRTGYIKSFDACAVMGTRLRKLSVVTTSMGKHRGFFMALTAYRSVNRSCLPVRDNLFGHLSAKKAVVCVAEGLRHLRLPPVDMSDDLVGLFGRMTRLEHLCLDPFTRMALRQPHKPAQQTPLAFLLRVLPRTTMRSLSFRCPDWDTVGLIGELFPRLESLSLHLPEYWSSRATSYWGRLGAGCSNLERLRLCFFSSGGTSQRDAIRDSLMALPALRHLFLFSVDNLIDTICSLTTHLERAEFPRIQTFEVINPDYPWDNSRVAPSGDQQKREAELVERMRIVMPNARINLRSTAPWEADFPS